jgi:type 1 glutamine amidotransferase
MKKSIILSALLAVACTLPGMAAEPLRVFIRGGVKTHGPGAHDHPRFLAEWTKLLNERGAKADGSLEFPTAEQIEASDVIVFYAANAGAMKPEQRKLIDAFRERGGGMVVIHDAVCGDDAPWFKTLIGGAWEHGKSKWYEGPMNLNYVAAAAEHPVTKGAISFHMDDEIYWDLHINPDAKILATSDNKKCPDAPQMWSLEVGKARTFTSIPGHLYTTFDLPHYKAILLRGIAWAGHRDVDLLTKPDEVAALAKPTVAEKKAEEGATFQLKIN